MNNEPVAYRWKSDLGYIYDIYDYGNGEPLYTHPVDKSANEISALIKLTGEYRSMMAHPAKTLTANEIEDCYQLWQALSGDPEKLYQLFKLKEQEK
jgi:hypothetical protein